MLKDAPLRVLIVKRSAQSFFPSSMVFPGGMVDAEDHHDDWLPHLCGHEDLEIHHRARRIAACREAWEEASVLAAIGDPPNAAPAAGADFRSVLARTGSRLDLSRLVPLSRWVTPELLERRYDNQFFLTRAPEHDDAQCDGHEITSTHWVEPRQAISRFEEGGTSILFSTAMNLHWLARFETVDHALEAARAMPDVPIFPRRADDDDGAWIAIQADSGYPVTRVRANVQPGPVT